MKILNLEYETFNFMNFRLTIRICLVIKVPSKSNNKNLILDSSGYIDYTRCAMILLKYNLVFITNNILMVNMPQCQGYRDYPGYRGHFHT